MLPVPSKHTPQAWLWHLCDAPQPHGMLHSLCPAKTLHTPVPLPPQLTSLWEEGQGTRFKTCWWDVNKLSTNRAKTTPSSSPPLLKPASSPLTGEVFAQTTAAMAVFKLLVHQGRENAPQNHQAVHQLLNYKIIIIKLKRKTKTTQPNHCWCYWLGCSTLPRGDKDIWKAHTCISDSHILLHSPACSSHLLPPPSATSSGVSPGHWALVGAAASKRWQLLRGNFRTSMLWQHCF